MEEKKNRPKAPKINYTPCYNPYSMGFDSSVGLFYGVDLSRKKEKVYTMIDPFTKDDNGKFVNDTSEPKFIETGEIDVYEKIQSFADSVDIYKIIDRCLISGNDDLLNVKKGVYGDVSKYPDNLNDLNEFNNGVLDSLNIYDDDIKKDILSDISVNDIVNKVNKLNEDIKNDGKEEK